MDKSDLAALEHDVAQETAACIARNEQRIAFLTEREEREAFLRKPVTQWTDAEWREFHRYENDARKWTRSW
ncbi:hypothetical protein EZH22_24590 [Xanthobacter dioxanivorans]|uniref:Uncharacterized protein n=1 Tax=Xanthobacter dioxanivorans TaxID=2528964 RepID=A0A974SHX4_9HYPH|nr:hypothetical protein [Xanthobacter dioxanivorans]QRG06130.1 hypothetical protein EZH22_24590 [Xanthobacter dioxanivorans]